MRFLLWGLLLLGVVLRVILARPSYPEGKTVKITAKVREEPLVFENYQRILLLGLKVYLPKYPEVSYADEVVVTGVVFQGKLLGAKLIEIKEEKGFLLTIREKIIDFYRKTLPEPEASLIAGITLGSKSQIPASFWESLTNSGLAHVVVASGSNVSLVAGFLVGILTVFLSRRLVIPFILAGIWIYALLAGLEAPVIRAAVMGSIAFSAQILGKVTFAWRSLVLSAILMILIRPDWLGDLGFILSFVATGSLLLFQGRISNALKAIPVVFREGISTSLAAQIGVTPILFVTFGRFNILSPVANALVLWSIPLIMALGGLAGMAGIIFPFFAKPILYLIYPLCAWFVFVTRVFGQ